MKEALEIINRAKTNGFEFAFLPDADYETVKTLRQSYKIEMGWNNKYKTGYSIYSFGYIVTLN